MSLVCTFALTCDACGRLVTHKSLPVEANVLAIPIQREQVLDHDLCADCEQLVKDAFESIVGPMKELQRQKQRFS